MNSCRSRFLRDPGDTHFYIRGSRLHEICKLINNYHDVGEPVRSLFLFLLFPFTIHRPQLAVLKSGGDRLNMFLVDDFILLKFLFLLGHHRNSLISCPAVKGVEITDSFLGKYLVASLHLVDAPFKRSNYFSWVRHNRDHKMRKIGIDLHLHHLGINHDESKFIWAKLEKDTRDNRIDAD